MREEVSSLSETVSSIASYTVMATVVSLYLVSTNMTIQATIKTSQGDIHLDLYADKAPVTVTNFAYLALQGYYDNLLFHRVIENFMIQGGCPQGTGTGGPGYQFADEFHPELRHDGPGVLSMANSGPHTNGSQFFVTHTETPRLDGRHTVFGKIQSESDQNIVNKITQGDTITSIDIQGDTKSLFAQMQEFIEQVDKALAKK